MHSVFCWACRRAPLQCQGWESGFPVARSLTIDRQGRVCSVSIGGDYWATGMSAVQEIDHTVLRQTHSPLVAWCEKHKDVQPCVVLHVSGWSNVRIFKHFPLSFFTCPSLFRSPLHKHILYLFKLNVTEPLHVCVLCDRRQIQQFPSRTREAVSKHVVQKCLGFFFCWWNKLAEGTEKSRVLLRKGSKYALMRGNNPRKWNAY